MTTVPSKPAQHVGGVGFGVARVDDDRLAELGRELELRLEELPLAIARRPVAEVVEPGLPHGDRLLVLEQLAELVDPACLGIAGLVRVDPEGGEHLLVELGELERGPRRLDPRADGDDPVDAGRARAADQRRRAVRARIEVRVGVDHSSAARFCIRSSSAGTTTSGSSFLKSGFGFWSSCPAGSSLGDQLPTQVSYSPVEHFVLVALLADLAKLERAGDRALVPEQLVHRLRREREERREDRLQAVDRAAAPRRARWPRARDRCR